MFINKIILPCILFIALPVLLTAQNNSSPYSVLGIGDIENSAFNRYTGMANSGVAMDDNRYINNSNAASLTSLPLHLYTFELSGRFKQVLYTGANVQSPNDKTTDFAMRRLSLAARLNKWWGSGVGLQPFSTASYSFQAYKNLRGTLTNIPVTYEGQGGVNQAYWANGFKLSKYTSVGVTSSYLFGSLEQSENIGGTTDAGSIVTKKNTYLHNLYFNFALLTKLKLSSSWMSSYGITFTPKTSLASTYTVNLANGAGTAIKTGDSINSYYNLPTSINAGIAFTKDDQYTYTVNAQTQYWSNLNYKGEGYQLVNSNRLSLGFQNSLKLRNHFNQEYEMGFFQLGVYAGNSYLKVNNQQITDYGASVGFGRNSGRSTFGFAAALEVGRRGSTNKNLLSENYINLSITLSYLDLLYSNKKR